jgi:hypothetical protein
MHRRATIQYQETRTSKLNKRVRCVIGWRPQSLMLFSPSLCSERPLHSILQMSAGGLQVLAYLLHRMHLSNKAASLQLYLKAASATDSRKHIPTLSFISRRPHACVLKRSSHANSAEETRKTLNESNSRSLTVRICSFSS